MYYCTLCTICYCIVRCAHQVYFWTRYGDHLGSDAIIAACEHVPGSSSKALRRHGRDQSRQLGTSDNIFSERRLYYNICRWRLEQPQRIASQQQTEKNVYIVPQSSAAFLPTSFPVMSICVRAVIALWYWGSPMRGAVAAPRRTGCSRLLFPPKIKLPNGVTPSRTQSYCPVWWTHAMPTSQGSSYLLARCILS